MQENPEPQPTHKPRRSRWFTSLLILLCLPLLLVAAIVYANRPHWITYTSPLLPGTNFRLSVQMPDTWAPEKWEVTDISYWKGTQLSFHQREPQRVSKWLYQHMFHIKTDVWANDSIAFVLKIRSDNYKDIPTLINWVKERDVNPVDPESIHEYRFVLGAALEWQTSSRIDPNYLADVLTILPTEIASNNKALDVYVEFIGDKNHCKQVHSTLLAAAKRVRLTTSPSESIQPQQLLRATMQRTTSSD